MISHYPGGYGSFGFGKSSLIRGQLPAFYSSGRRPDHYERGNQAVYSVTEWTHCNPGPSANQKQICKTHFKADKDTEYAGRKHISTISRSAKG